MDNSQPQKYIREAIDSGSSINQIRQDLLSAGWPQSVIEPYLTNQTTSTNQAVQPPSSVSSVVSTTQTYSNAQSITEPSKPKTSIVTKIALGALGLGVVLIVIFMILINIGKSIYVSPKTDFSQNNIQKELNLDLTTTDNPYRIFLYAKYIVKGKPYGIDNKLFDYNISITNDQGGQIVTTNGTYEYHKTSSSSDNKTSLSTQNINTTLPTKDFQIKNNGNYKVVAKIAIPESLDSNFTLSDWNFEIKGKVLTPPPFLIFIGIMLVIVSFILLFSSRKKFIPIHRGGG